MSFRPMLEDSRWGHDGIQINPFKVRSFWFRGLRLTIQGQGCTHQCDSSEALVWLLGKDSCRDPPKKVLHWRV